MRCLKNRQRKKEMRWTNKPEKRGKTPTYGNIDREILKNGGDIIEK
jgi:hypothetical protein